MLPSNSQLKCVIRLLPFFSCFLRLYPGREHTRIFAGEICATAANAETKVRRKSISSFGASDCFTASVKVFFNSVPKVILLIPFTIAGRSNSYGTLTMMDA